MLISIDFIIGDLSATHQNRDMTYTNLNTYTTNTLRPTQNQSTRRPPKSLNPPANQRSHPSLKELQTHILHTLPVIHEPHLQTHNTNSKHKLHPNTTLTNTTHRPHDTLTNNQNTRALTTPTHQQPITPIIIHYIRAKVESQLNPQGYA